MTLSRARWARYDRDSSGLYTTLGPGNSNCRQRGILIVANQWFPVFVGTDESPLDPGVPKPLTESGPAKPRYPDTTVCVRAINASLSWRVDVRLVGTSRN